MILGVDALLSRWRQYTRERRESGRDPAAVSLLRSHPSDSHELAAELLERLAEPDGWTSQWPEAEGAFLFYGSDPKMHEPQLQVVNAGFNRDGELMLIGRHALLEPRRHCGVFYRLDIELPEVPE